MNKPDWIKILYNENNVMPVADYLEKYNINTVCENALCPNRWTCYAHKEVTFMILGAQCTRRCLFCGVSKGIPEQVNEYESEKLLSAVKWLGIDYAVITSVTRDDLPDRGAGRFAKIIQTLKNSSILVEVLIPDFDGDKELIKMVMNVCPDVMAYNMETVQRLYPSVRSLSDYSTSLNVLESIKKIKKDMITKSGFMLGLGENISEVKSLMRDIRSTDCDILTIGQYLRPSLNSMEVRSYAHPEVFETLKNFGRKLGFKVVESAPFVRSSLHAKQMYTDAKLRNKEDIC